MDRRRAHRHRPGGGIPGSSAGMNSRKYYYVHSTRISAYFHLVALAPTVPVFLCDGPRRFRRCDGRILVVIELKGGNDGINTVVPYSDEGYAKHRKVLRLPPARLHKITKDVGLHPAMGDAAQLLESGRLAIVQGVAIPIRPGRTSSRWPSGIPPTSTLKMTLAIQTPRRPTAGLARRWMRTASPSMGRRRRSSWAAARCRWRCGAGVRRPRPSPVWTTRYWRLKANTGSAMMDGGAAAPAAFIRRSTLDAYATSERMSALLHAEDKGPRYPASGLAERLRLNRRLINSASGTVTVPHRQDGYDTHYAQLDIHERVLSELAGAVRAFLDDVTAAKLADRVAMLLFSEFGRTVSENGSGGTDHGTSGPVFLCRRARWRSGLAGATPSLLDLDPKYGDLRTVTDFRRIYATVLEDWLGLPARSAPGRRFREAAALPRLRRGPASLPEPPAILEEFLISSIRCIVAEGRSPMTLWGQGSGDT